MALKHQSPRIYLVADYDYCEERCKPDNHIRRHVRLSNDAKGTRIEMSENRAPRIIRSVTVSTYVFVTNHVARE